MYRSCYGDYLGLSQLHEARGQRASIELALVVKTLVHGSSAWIGLENANHATSTSIILGCDSEHSLVA